MHKEVNNGKSKIKTKLTEHHKTNDGLHDRLDLQTKSIAWKLHFLFTMFSATKCLVNKRRAASPVAGDGMNHSMQIVPAYAHIGCPITMIHRIY